MADAPQQFTEWCPELESALAEPFPREVHSQKGGKGTFVSVHHYAARLNSLVGVSGWSMEPPRPFIAGHKLGLAVGVTILGVTKWNVGDEMEDHGEPIEYTDEQTGEVREKVVDFGSSCTNSWAQAFKRCLAYGFRMGLYLYDKNWTRKYLRSQPAAATANGSGASKPSATTADPTCPRCDGAMWNNMAKKAAGEMKPGAPDYKCKDKACADAGGLYWPGEWPPPEDPPSELPPAEGQPAMATDAQVIAIAAARKKITDMGGDGTQLDPLMEEARERTLTAVRAANAIIKAQKWIDQQVDAAVGTAPADELPF